MGLAWCVATDVAVAEARSQSGDGRDPFCRKLLDSDAVGCRTSSVKNLATLYQGTMPEPVFLKEIGPRDVVQATADGCSACHVLLPEWVMTSISAANLRFVHLSINSCL